MEIRKYGDGDRQKISDLFFDQIQSDRSYISHGEMQMGLSSDGVDLLPDYKSKWMDYFDRMIHGSDSLVFVMEDGEELAGFVICGIEHDHTTPYGVIYDIVIREIYRGAGLANRLLDHAIGELSLRGASDYYLESGVNNHHAHRFFEKNGFKHVSNVYRLSTH